MTDIRSMAGGLRAIVRKIERDGPQKKRALANYIPGKYRKSYSASEIISYGLDNGIIKVNDERMFELAENSILSWLDDNWQDSSDFYKLDHRRTVLYRFFDDSMNLLYVGISSNGPHRFSDHSLEKPWWTDVSFVKVDHYETRSQAFDAERIAIQTQRPKYNKIHN